MENSPSHGTFYLPQIEHLSYFKPLHSSAEVPNPKKVNRSLSSELKVTFFNGNHNADSPTLAKQKLLSEIKASEVNLNCQDHPDEDVQFYSFTNNKGLCSECLLSGKYTGCEVVGLKKAADRIRPKFDSLILDVADKAGPLGLLLEKLVTEKRGFNDFGVDFKNEIKEQFERLRAAINQKEEELLESVDKAKKEHQDAVEVKYEAVKKGYQEILNLRNTLSSKLESSKEFELCQYYASKANLIQKFVDEESNSASKELKSNIQTENLSEQFNLSSYNEEINAIIKRVNALKGLEKNVKIFEAAVSQEVKSTPKLELLESVISREVKTTPKLELLESAVSREVKSTPKLEPVEIMPEIKPFKNSIPQNSPQNEEESILESEISLNLSRKTINLRDIKKEKDTLRARSTTPFETLKDELDPISPLSKATEDSPMSPTEEKIRRLFEKVGSIGKPTQPKESIREQKSDFKAQSSSFISYLDTQKPRETLRKSVDWNTPKEPLIVDQGLKRSDTTYSTIKLIDLDNTRDSKVVPKSFLTNFSSTKPSTREDGFPKASTKDLLNSNWINGSTKNLKTVPQEETTTKQTTPTWNSLLKTRQRNEETISVTRSFGSSALSSNLRQLKKQIGLGGDLI